MYKRQILAVNDGYSLIESRLLAKIFDPNNIKLRSKKSEPESQKVNPRKTKPPRSFGNHTQKTATNIQPEVTGEPLPTTNQPLISQEEVSLASSSELLEMKQSNSSIEKTPSTATPVIESEVVNSEVVNSEVTISNLDLVETVKQNDLVQSLEIEHNNLSEDQESNYSLSLIHI